ncbi:hypothetical protein GGD81_000284 [Rhodobium orientis]|uniref:DUF1513 domain-containing protein n=1 Tax=Rhodobium orientis TaxID=34017 RepID=A0A327JYB5_9HYPH|nr:DUF1513 domain-containing protein [Rhodobium orientis]MBB4301269.1 hypothetical protein [Rhodobium orientis]MBK5951140.1 hypothetical protein [Rhodobium orientis]RAI29972.1 hypothetical protein CH339_00075 [Rhodobium orientis]
MIEIDRRRFLAGALASGLATAVAVPAEASGGEATYVTAIRNADGSFGVAVLNAEGTLLFTDTMEGRGHGATVSPDNSTAVVFGRRPGKFAAVVDIAAGRIVRTIPAAKGRHFCGHGLYTPDGRLLYATENAYELEKGMLGVYDVAADYRRIGEIWTGGIGPHETLLMPDGKMAVVANGGILIDPMYGRQKLNIATMEPSLAYLDLESGDVVDKMELGPERHQLSIRHISIDGEGAVWFGCQYEGPKTDRVPLIGKHKREGEPQMMSAPPQVMRGYRQYVGSVATSRDGTHVATSSPRGGVMTIWNCATGTIVSEAKVEDVCGLAPDAGNAFFGTSGTGLVFDGDRNLARYPGIAFDNHMRMV